MNFTEWYEANKEALSVCAPAESMRRAWNAGKSVGVDVGIRFTETAIKHEKNLDCAGCFDEI